MSDAPNFQALMAGKRLSKAFGAVLQRHRMRSGLSQEALAAKAGVHRTHVGLVERGERNASLDVAHSLAQALATPLSKLIRETERAMSR